MVCDGILAPPSVTLSKAGGSWRTSQVAITRTDVSVLAYSVFNVQQRFPKKDPSTIYEQRRAKSQGSQRNFSRKFVVVVKQR